MRLAVAFTVSGERPDYLKRTLDSWHAVRGISNVRVVLCCEPAEAPREPALRQAVAAAFPGSRVVVNERRLNCAANTAQAIRFAFDDHALPEDRPGFVVCAEEDIEVAPGVLEYFSWAADTYVRDEKIAAVCAHAFRLDGQVPPSGVVRRSWFSPWVWGTWHPRWAQMYRGGWQGAGGDSEAWDAGLRGWLQVQGKQCLFPVRSLARHFGEVSVLRSPGVKSWYPPDATTCFVPDTPPQQFTEVPDSTGFSLVV